MQTSTQTQQALVPEQPMAPVPQRQQAFGYLRVSGQSQVDGDGFPRQRLAIERYAAANGITIAGWFEERAVRGATEWENRPAWGEMLKAIDGDVRTIVFESLNRLARDLMVQEHIIADLRARRITPVSVAEPDLGSEEPTRVMMRQIMGAIAQYDKAMIVLKLRGARQRKRAAGGRCEGRKPYGHYAAEVAGLEVIRAAVVCGSSAQEIAQALEARGIPPRTGGRWHPWAVARIMARETRGEEVA